MIEVKEHYKIYNGECIQECPSNTQEAEENGKKTCKVKIFWLLVFLIFYKSKSKLKSTVDNCINHFVSKSRNASTVQSGVLPVE